MGPAVEKASPGVRGAARRRGVQEETGSAGRRTTRGQWPRCRVGSRAGRQLAPSLPGTQGLIGPVRVKTSTGSCSCWTPLRVPDYLPATLALPCASLFRRRTWGRERGNPGNTDVVDRPRREGTMSRPARPESYNGGQDSWASPGRKESPMLANGCTLRPRSTFDRGPSTKWKN